jgi:hypothetical protein
VIFALPMVIDDPDWGLFIGILKDLSE